MRQPVNDHVIRTRLAQVKGLDSDAFNLEPDGLLAQLEFKIKFLEKFLVTDGPAYIRPEGQSDSSCSGRHGSYYPYKAMLPL
jgi:hypothetical protein